MAHKVYNEETFSEQGVHIPANPMKPYNKHTWTDNVAARVVLCIAILAIGYLLIIYHDAMQWLLLGKLYYKEILVAAIVIALLMLPVIPIRKFFKDKNSSVWHYRQTLDYQTNRKYSTALWLLCKRNDKLANALGLKNFIQLKQDGLVEPKHVDAMTVARNLSGAPLSRANLQGANIEEINMQEANLKEANLKEANLKEANLKGADLEGANLQEADLQGANLEGVKNLDPGMLRKAKNWREAKLDPTLRQRTEEADMAAGEEPGEAGSLPGTMGLKNQ